MMLRKLTVALLVGGVLAGMTSEALAYRGWGGRGGWGVRHAWGGGWNRGWGRVGWGRGGYGWGWGGLGLGLGLGALAYDAGYPYYDYGYYGGYGYPGYTTAYGGCW